MGKYRTFHCNFCEKEWKSQIKGLPKYCPKCHNPRHKKPRHNMRKFAK